MLKERYDKDGWGSLKEWSLEDGVFVKYWICFYVIVFYIIGLEIKLFRWFYVVLKVLYKICIYEI